MSYIDDYKKYLEEFDKRWDKKVAELKADIEEAFAKIRREAAANESNSNKLHEEEVKTYKASEVMKILNIRWLTLYNYYKLGYIKKEANNKYNASDVEALKNYLTTHKQVRKESYVRKL